MRGYVRPLQTEDSENREWLKFNHIPRRGLIYPERLRIDHPIAFDLILPGPATIPLVRMLEEYSKLVPTFRDLVSISYLWCHSLGMREISPTCLALLFVSFLQVRLPPPWHFCSLNLPHRKPLGYLVSRFLQVPSVTTMANNTTFRRPAANGRSTKFHLAVNGQMRLWH